jgi:hypothetical protein
MIECIGINEKFLKKSLQMIKHGSTVLVPKLSCNYNGNSLPFPSLNEKSISWLQQNRNYVDSIAKGSAP